MFVVRPVHPDDLDQLFELSALAMFGLTTLPRDRDYLAKRIQQSVLGFEHLARDIEKPSGEAYLFVAEDLTTGKLAGTSGVVSKVGGFEPFYAYRIETSVHKSKTLKLTKEVKALHLVEEHNGPCEIGSLFLSPHFRGSGAGRLLSLVRFLFMAQFSERFDPVVIAEMRGVIDEKGHSPFWDALGKHFFDLDFPKADYMSMVNKAFIGELMPRHPIYIPLLPEAAQEVIGQVHPNTAPARAILEREGFTFDEMVDIFEAGPILRCDLKKVRTVKESRTGKLTEILEEEPTKGKAKKKGNKQPADAAAVPFVISNTEPAFRACIGHVREAGKRSFAIDRVTALTLNVKLGDTLRIVEVKPA